MASSREPAVTGSIAPSTSANNSNKEYNLILVKGRGKKRKYNRKHARLVSPRVNKGGWVSVQVQGGEQNISWRSKAWKVTKVNCNLEDLPDECLVRIFSFLGAGEHIVDTSNEALQRNFSEDHLEQMENWSVAFVDTKFSLKEAVQLHKTMALLSKRFHRLSIRCLPSILGHLDADFTGYLYPWYQYTPWLTSNKLCLRSLKLSSEAWQDCAILLYILEKCNVTRMTSLVGCFQSFGPNPRRAHKWTLVDWAHQQVFRSSSIIQVGENSHCSPVTLETLKSKAADLGLRDLYDYQVDTRGEFHDAIARLCPALTNLKLIHELGNHVDPNISRGDLFRKTTVLQLKLVLCVAADEIDLHLLPGDDTKGLYSTISVSEVVSAFPNLKVLQVANSNHEYIHGTLFQLASTSLQQIDWRDAGKQNWITRCQCPSLYRLLCLSDCCGNGVVPRTHGPNVHREDYRSCAGEYLAGNTRFDVTLQWDGGIVLEGIDVPDSCIVSLQHV